MQFVTPSISLTNYPGQKSKPTWSRTKELLNNRPTLSDNSQNTNNLPPSYLRFSKAKNFLLIPLKGLALLLKIWTNFSHIWRPWIGTLRLSSISHWLEDSTIILDLFSKSYSKIMGKSLDRFLEEEDMTISSACFLIIKYPLLVAPLEFKDFSIFCKKCTPIKLSQTRAKCWFLLSERFLLSQSSQFFPNFGNLVSMHK